MAFIFINFEFEFLLDKFRYRPFDSTHEEQIDKKPKIAQFPPIETPMMWMSRLGILRLLSHTTQYQESIQKISGKPPTEIQQIKNTQGEATKVTKTVALYCCEQGYQIRCNSVHPAAILTPMWEPMLRQGPEREIRMAEITKDIPMQKMGTVEDVANAVLFLASDESKYITGIELTVDGGILAGASVTQKKEE